MRASPSRLNYLLRTDFLQHFLELGTGFDTRRRRRGTNIKITTDGNMGKKVSEILFPLNDADEDLG